MVAEDLAEVGEADEALAVTRQQADPRGGNARVDEEATDQQERRPNPDPGPDLRLLAWGQTPNQPVGEEDVEDEHHRDADDGGDQVREPLGVHGGLSLPT